MNIDHKRQNSDINASSPQSPKRTLTAAERRALEAEKRAAMRQQRMRELEEDAMKAQCPPLRSRPSRSIPRMRKGKPVIMNFTTVALEVWGGGPAAHQQNQHNAVYNLHREVLIM